MAWIEVHTNLPDHPKVLRAAKALKIDSDALVGKLIRLWTWALENRENGLLSDLDVERIAFLMNYTGRDKLFDVLVANGLLDATNDGGASIHDWDEHVAMLMEKREIKREQARLRKQKQRDKSRNSHAEVSRDMSVTSHAENGVTSHAGHAVTVPYRTVPDIDIMTDTISVYPAREEQELSTGSAQPKERVEGVWMWVMNTTPSEEELKTVLRHSVGMDISAVQYALELACLYGAANPAAYAARVLNEWNTLGIRTEAAAREWREGADGV